MAATIDDTLTTPQVDGPTKFVNDFPTVPEPTSLTQGYMVLEDNLPAYALGTAHPDHPNYYLVRVGQRQPLGGGLVRYQLEYAKIPAPRIEHQSYGWEVPGTGTETPPGSLINISGSTIASLQHTLTLATAHGGDVGQMLRVTYTETTSNGSVSLTVVRPLLAGSSGTTAVINQIQTQGTIVFQTAQVIDVGRDPETKEVHSEIRYDYWMLGQTVPTAADIPIIDEYPGAVLNSDGKDTGILTETTSPTKAEYLAKVAANDFICAVASTYQSWKGPIYVRKTRFVRAV